jgi:uroporphyrinogen-III synthase
MAELKGIRVRVTRPAHQADNLCRLIEEHGGTAVRLPAIEIVPNTEYSKIADVLKSREKFQWIVFISANAVNFALRAINGKIDQLHGSRIAAIGKATANALNLAGLSVHLVPDQGHDSESLLAMPELQSMSGQKVLIVRGSGGREELSDVLRKRGAEVEYLEVYRRIIPSIDYSFAAEMLANNQLDVITATSGEALQNLSAMLGEHNHKRLTELPLVVISGRIAHIAADRGFKRIFVTACPTDTSILDTLIKCTTGEQSDRSE